MTCLQISGCVLLAVGVWILVDPSKKYLFELIASNTGTSEVLEYLSYALCALGGFVVLVGFFGCCGAMQESKCMLVTVRRLYLENNNNLLLFFIFFVRTVLSLLVPDPLRRIDCRNILLHIPWGPPR